MLSKLFARGGVKDALSKGLVIGENCRFNGKESFGSEPWLITIGNHVELSSEVSFVTHDGATWVFRNQERYKDVIRYGKIVIRDH